MARIGRALVAIRRAVSPKPTVGASAKIIVDSIFTRAAVGARDSRAIVDVRLA